MKEVDLPAVGCPDGAPGGGMMMDKGAGHPDNDVS